MAALVAVDFFVYNFGLMTDLCDITWHVLEDFSRFSTLGSELDDLLKIKVVFL